jgi:hypothetical protein
MKETKEIADYCNEIIKEYGLQDLLKYKSNLYGGRLYISLNN